MWKNYRFEILFGCLLIMAALGLFMYFNYYEPENWIKILIIVIITCMVGALYLRNFKKKHLTISRGENTEDEFTHLVKLHAGSRSFLLSMFLWWLIFMFNDVFTDREDMLGIGILGSGALYGICYWYYNSTASFYEK